ncbi:MAG TPA: helix-turn-helix transcriptional regulator [Ferruginibacter sp.]|jgi:DNA-binding XRE family transcriptional regulator|nr:helix-turn-helix transcriptional regulator [Bacteroidota bacterium]MBS1924812.1 helix-turn-helix transcriptional regulator [Bacteroidota bacterium]MCC6691955.1 helix-turn-helix transcriptional regulator [Chitinophagaceae bacterium]HMT96411.1 helix-turn-helix transcriptional regulator [Ferruginibacter sp.]HMU25260.1 helix-turn-helix transcriptional regulator [Ferruginibacter sp.]
MEHLKKLGEQITKRRELLSLTQKDVATAVNLSDATIRFIERGRPGVSIANWIKVADLLGLEIQVLNKKMSAEK